MTALALFAACAASAQSGHGSRRFNPSDLEGVWTNQTQTRLERPDAYRSLIATDAEMKAREERLAAARARKEQPKASGDASSGDVGQGQSEFVDRNDNLMVIDGRPRTSIITDPSDGRLPFTPEGKRLSEAAATPTFNGYENPEDRSASERCIASPSQAGPPMMSGPDDANYQIVQTPGRVGILSEMIHDMRIVRVDGTHPRSRLHPVQGDATGRWDRGTLVIETVDQSPLTMVREVDGSILLISPTAKVTERLRRISPTELRYNFTIEDARFYLRPWSGEMVLRRVEKPIYEYACHEGNYALVNVLSGAREKEKRQAALDASRKP